MLILYSHFLKILVALSHAP